MNSDMQSCEEFGTEWFRNHDSGHYADVDFEFLIRPAGCTPDASGSAGYPLQGIYMSSTSFYLPLVLDLFMTHAFPGVGTSVLMISIPRCCWQAPRTQLSRTRQKGVCTWLQPTSSSCMMRPLQQPARPALVVVLTLDLSRWSRSVSTTFRSRVELHSQRHMLGSRSTKSTSRSRQIRSPSRSGASTLAMQQLRRQRTAHAGVAEVQ